jgi:hypothetical protein
MWTCGFHQMNWRTAQEPGDEIAKKTTKCRTNYNTERQMGEREGCAFNDYDPKHAVAAAPVVVPIHAPPFDARTLRP